MATKEPNRNVYVGHRYVPKLMGEWDQTFTYEGLSIVTHLGASYTSKKRIPVGVPIENEEYWVITGNYDAQVENYRMETKKNKDKLATVRTKISYFPKEETELDDTARLQRAIEHAAANQNELVLDQPLTISQQMNIPNDARIFGVNGMAVKVNVVEGIGFLVEGSNVLLRGIPLDGMNVVRTLVQVGSYNKVKNVDIENCDFKNVYSQLFGSSGVRGIDAENVHVTGNHFENINSLENGIVGDGIGSARGVWFSDVKNGSVIRNEFDGIGGFEDGDAVHCQTTGKEVSCLIEGNLFINTKKRAIKLQSPNNTVRRNIIKSSFTHATNCPQSAISDYDYNNVIEGNLIELARSFTGLDLSRSVNCQVSGNTISIDPGGVYDAATTRGEFPRLISYDKVTKLGFRHNILIGKQRKFTGNDGSDVVIDDNLFEEGGNHFIALTNFNGLKITNNKFKSLSTNVPYEMVRLENTKDLILDGNEFGEVDIPVRFYGTGEGIVILPNIFKKINTSSRYRTSDMTAGQAANVKIIGDYEIGKSSIPIGATEVTVLYSLGRPINHVAITPQNSYIGNFRVGSGGDAGFKVYLTEPNPTSFPFMWKAE